MLTDEPWMCPGDWGLFKASESVLSGYISKVLPKLSVLLGSYVENNFPTWMAVENVSLAETSNITHERSKMGRVEPPSRATHQSRVSARRPSPYLVPRFCAVTAGRSDHPRRRGGLREGGGAKVDLHCDGKKTNTSGLTARVLGAEEIDV